MIEIDYDLFNSKLFKLSFLNRKYRLLPNINGIVKNKKSVVLFNDNNISKYINDFKNVTLFNYSESQYKHFTKKNIIHYKQKELNTILFFNKEYFHNLTGRKNKSIRNIVTKFSNRFNFDVLTHPKAFADFYDFIKLWEKMRKHRHFLICTGYDKNFFEKYLFNYSKKIFPLFFYLNDKMVGYSIIENVNGNLFNLLFRKSDTSFNGLSQYIDFISFQHISNLFQSDIIINMGSDMGDKKLRFNKTHTFNVEKLELITFKIKIFKNQEKS